MFNMKKFLVNCHKKDKEENANARQGWNSEAKSLVNFTIANRYRLTKRMGSGAQGDVYVAIEKNSGEEVAIKVESASVDSISNLKIEFDRYKMLLCDGNNDAVSTNELSCVPKVFWYGSDVIRDQYNAMVMEKQGPSLNALFKLCWERFTLKTVLLLADQMLRRIQHTHTRGIIHRDIKPANFVIGAEARARTVYILDYGLSQVYYDTKKGKHVKPERNQGFTGTPVFASLNAHEGLRQSRRDDMESIGYVLIYFLNGELPWTNVSATTTNMMLQDIHKMKKKTSVKDLCHNCPPEFEQYLTRCRDLQFDEMPQYQYMRQIFRLLYQRHFASSNDAFDWEVETGSSNM